MIRTAVLRLCGHWNNGPRGVADQSKALMRSPKSPPPATNDGLSEVIRLAPDPHDEERLENLGFGLRTALAGRFGPKPKRLPQQLVPASDSREWANGGLIFCRDYRQGRRDAFVL
jgi:hypothetical protein